MNILPEEKTLIRNWWNGRISAGTQLTDVGKYTVGFDYQGKGPWFKAVGEKALFADFLSDPDVVRAGYECTPLRFTLMFKKEIPYIARKSVPHRIVFTAYWPSSFHVYGMIYKFGPKPQTVLPL